MGRIRHLIAAGGLAGLGLLFGAAGAAAQEGGGLCANPQSFCQRFIKPACLGALGAGAEAIAKGDCNAQLDAYRTCVAAAAETCGAAAAATPRRKIGGIFTIATNLAKLLKEPSVSAKTKNVGVAAKGSVVRLLEEGPNGQFVRIEVLSATPSMGLLGNRGWTPVDAIRPAPASSAPTSLKVGDRAQVETYTVALGANPTADGATLTAKGWMTRGSVVEVLERFEDPTDGVYIRFKPIEAAKGSQPKAEDGWTPEANLKKAP